MKTPDQPAKGKAENYGKENLFKRRSQQPATNVRLFRAGRVERAVGGRFYPMAGASHQFAKGRGWDMANHGGIVAGHASLPFPRGRPVAR